MGKQQLGFCGQIVALIGLATVLSASAAMGQSNSLFHRNARNPAANPAGPAVSPDDESAGQTAPATPVVAGQGTVNSQTNTVAAGAAAPTGSAGSVGKTAGQSASPTPTGQPGQPGQPTAVDSPADETNRPVVLSAGPAAGEAGATSPATTTPPAGQAPADQTRPVALPSPAPVPVVLADSLATPATLTARSDPNQREAGQPYSSDSVNGTNGNDRNGSPSLAALSKASFLATAPPEARKFRVHDLVTIVVNETSTFSSDGSTLQDKKNNVDLKFTSWLKMHKADLVVNTPPSTPPELKIDAERKYEGDGTVKRSDSFVGRLTAEIIDVKPNGTLVVTATKFIKTDDEEQTFELSGTCRVTDINADNSVLSTQLSDLAVRKMHKGAVTDATKRGFFQWITDKVNP
jgi:flagellar L-ring protein precursor FlgH